jgi:outer membrane lipoprotein SlyB
MRWAIRGCGIGLLALASCASSGASSGPSPASTAAKISDRAVVLAERPVPAGGVEYVVRTDDGTTLAIVQPATPGLRPGAFVTMVRGDRTILAAR